MVWCQDVYSRHANIDAQDPNFFILMFENINSLKAKCPNLWFWVDPIHNFEEMDVVASLISHKDQAKFTYAL